MNILVRGEDGRSLAGSDQEARGLIEEVSAQTGGSSLRGAWSFIFGLPHRDVVPAAMVDQLADEADNCRLMLGDRLSPEAMNLLGRLAALRNQP